MAVVNTKATVITAGDSSTFLASKIGLANGKVRRAIGTVETVSGDDIASVYRLARVHSSWFVDTVKLYSDDIGATTIADFGIYQTADNGGAVVDANFFASAVSLKDGAIAGTEIQHQSGVYGVEDVEKPLWEALGLSADPKRYYDVCATLTAAADAAGTISLRVAMVAND